MQKYDIARFAKINNLACYLVSSMCLAWLSGCGGKPATPSKNYPEQILFQHIRMKLNKAFIEIHINYESGGSVGLSSAEGETHYFSINQDKYLFDTEQIIPIFFTENLLFTCYLFQNSYFTLGSLNEEKKKISC